MINHAELTYHLSYDPDTGLFTWKTPTANKHKPGTLAGTTNAEGYVSIKFKGTIYKAHRLAWFYCFEEWPNGYIDHIKGDPSDNRLDNLREANVAESNFNRGIRKTNKIGYKGVSLHACGKYVAQIQVNRKKVNLGLYTTPEEAHSVYLEKAKECFGTFNSLNNVRGN